MALSGSHPLWLALGGILALLAWPGARIHGEEASFVPVTTAAELEACIADPATPFCELTQSILFTGNQTSQFMELLPPPNALSVLRCAPGVSIVWDNADAAPAFGVNVVRVSLFDSETFIVQDCTLETRVNGDPEVGQDVSVQLFFARHPPIGIETLSTVVILGGRYKTAHYGASTIALGCNCLGPTEWTLADVIAEGPIALDAKGDASDGSPLEWHLLNTQLIGRTPAMADVRCFKQKGSVRIASADQSSCENGILSFSLGFNPQQHDLDGLTFKNSPVVDVLAGCMIFLASQHGLSGSIRVEGAPGDGDPGDARTQNLLCAPGGALDLDLDVEFEDCHRTFSPDLGDTTLDLRPGPFDDVRVQLQGPASCGDPTEFWDARTLQTLADNESNGYLLTNGGVSFELIEGTPVPEPGIGIGLLCGCGLVLGLQRRRVRSR